MSPMKVFEYMASNRPIIATDLPTIMEILIDQETAILVSPDDSRALARGIEKVMVNRQVGQSLSEVAYKEVLEKYTWEKRAKKIIEFLHWVYSSGTIYR